jgi:Tfp pilus assembly protein PilO
MMRFITPIILIAISVTLFFMYANPLYNDISGLKAQVASYNSALSNSKMLESQRDKLTAQYDAMDPDNLARLQKLLPNNVDNIRLILEIEQIAAPYGMTLTNIKYDTTDANANTATTVASAIPGGGVAKQQVSDYGTFNLEFSTSGSYDNFISFTKDLESNLRIVDISSISFSSTTTAPSASSSPSSSVSRANSPVIYQYDFNIKTYWLKN